MAENVNVEVHQKEEKSLWDKIKEKVSSRQGVYLKESDRFSRLGYLDYPKKRQLDVRLATAIVILEEMEKTVSELATVTDDKQKYAIQAKNLFQLFRMFKTNGSPWMRGLDNRELAKKVKCFFELEMMIGYIPSAYPILKYCTEILLHLSWMAIDVSTQPPVLFETKTTVQPQGGASPLNPDASHIKREKK